MKKIFITSIVALALILGSAGSAQAVAGYTFSNYLTIGSTGADVSALQTFLIAGGFDIPAISSGAAAKGYFGQQTKMAVIKYQASVTLPNTGFVGPLTVAKLNGTAGVVAVAPTTCPAGYTCTANPGTVVAPTTPAVIGVVPAGTDGSVTVSLSSFAGNNTIKKGETKDMVAVKLQATAAAVAITRFDVRLNKRPWLYFSTITLKDSNGAVVATKNLSGPADATELTVGTDYLVRFEGISFVVTPGTDRILVVSGSVLATTDKLTSDVSVIVSVPDNSIRTTNGKGFTDTIGLGTVAVAGTSGRTITLSSSGSTGNIVGRISPSTPATRIVNTSTNGETTGVVLGKFDFKAENRGSTINTLTFGLKDNANNNPWSTMLKRVYISNGTQTIQTDAIPTGTSAVASTSLVFSNLNFALPQDAWTTFTVTADVADADDFVNGAMASSTITLVSTTNPVGIDTNFTTVTSGTNTITSNDITLLQSGASISSLSATASVNTVNQYPVTATIGFQFTFNNTGTSDLYISKEANTALATSSTVGVAASSTMESSKTVTSPSTVAGDTSTEFVIPSGTSRTFVYTGLIRGRGRGLGANESTSITKVYFDDDTTGLQEFKIAFGLEALQTPSKYLEN